jgi:hypothetical protein
MIVERTKIIVERSKSVLKSIRANSSSSFHMMQNNDKVFKSYLSLSKCSSSRFQNLQSSINVFIFWLRLEEILVECSFSIQNVSFFFFHSARFQVNEKINAFKLLSSFVYSLKLTLSHLYFAVSTLLSVIVHYFCNLRLENS